MDVLGVVLRELELDLEVEHTRSGSVNQHRQMGSKDDKDARGQWKATWRVSDRYDSVELPNVDTKIAAARCIMVPSSSLICTRDQRSIRMWLSFLVLSFCGVCSMPHCLAKSP
jgi:hypothetical protein